MLTTVRLMEAADGEAVERFLGRRPLHNLYLRSELARGATFGWWVACDEEHVSAVVAVGALTVVAMEDPRIAHRFEKPLCDRRIRTIVGERGGAHAAAAVRDLAEVHRELRDQQLLLRVRPELLPQALSCDLVVATRAQAEHLVITSAAMHSEEMGIDPLVHNPVGWRARVFDLIDRGWTFTWTVNGVIIFKADLSARREDAVQIQGVYTSPSQRGRGLATTGMTALCNRLLEEVPNITLYVNAHNVAGRALYDRLGMEQIGEMATFIY